MKTPLGLNFWSGVTALAALVAVVRPLLKITEKIDRYNKLWASYSELYYECGSLVAELKVLGGVDEARINRCTEIGERYRRLALQDDALPAGRLLNRCTAEVNKKHPPESLWVPDPPKVTDGKEAK